MTGCQVIGKLRGRDTPGRHTVGNMMVMPGGCRAVVGRNIGNASESMNMVAITIDATGARLLKA